MRRKANTELQETSRVEIFQKITLGADGRWVLGSTSRSRVTSEEAVEGDQEETTVTWTRVGIEEQGSELGFQVNDIKDSLCSPVRSQNIPGCGLKIPDK